MNINSISSYLVSMEVDTTIMGWMFVEMVQWLDAKERSERPRATLDKASSGRNISSMTRGQKIYSILEHQVYKIMVKGRMNE